MIEQTRAVFLTYASQDAEAARRICEPLQAAGIEVWFDQSELRAERRGIRRSAARFTIVPCFSRSSRKALILRLGSVTGDGSLDLVCRGFHFSTDLPGGVGDRVPGLGGFLRDGVPDGLGFFGDCMAEGRRFLSYLMSHDLGLVGHRVAHGLGAMGDCMSDADRIFFDSAREARGGTLGRAACRPHQGHRTGNNSAQNGGFHGAASYDGGGLIARH